MNRFIFVVSYVLFITKLPAGVAIEEFESQQSILPVLCNSMAFNFWLKKLQNKTVAGLGVGLVIIL